jgi:AcrR family transcriptional regulator
MVIDTMQPSAPDLPLRERKKLLIRQAIMENAERLFEARGYDQVTVAEIANASNVSVKTLFTYFRSKEDLLFQDTSLLNAILSALRKRASNLTPAQVVVATLMALLRERGAAAESLAAFQRGYGNSEALRGRLLRLWAEYEEAIATELAQQAGHAAPDADIRFDAAQLVLLIRALTWKEVHALALCAKDHSTREIETWLHRRASSFVS